eukprot:m.352907 g.352907  ORF g.352907 m.352907 type:complete len:187 (-) comp55917_c0_seq1:56-616(-)
MSLNLERKLSQKPKPPPKEKPELVILNSTTDHLRWRIEQMQRNPEAAANLPAPPKERAAPRPKEFNPNIHGSSAGAGSGEFHVYRHDKARETARQKWLDEQEVKRKRKEDFETTTAKKQEEDLSKTEKNRKKRQRRKQAQDKRAKKDAESGPKKDSDKAAAGSDESDSGEEEDEEEAEPHFVIGGK